MIRSVQLSAIDQKKLDDRELWIRRYRNKVLILMFLVIIIPLINYIFFT